MRNSLTVGQLKIFWLNGGEFEVDGGTMYGVTPKVLWQEKYPCIRDNYIVLVNRPILLQSPDGLVLIDCGLGNKYTEAERRLFRISTEWDIEAELRKLGVRRENIGHVILTHGDFDHAGGLVMATASGRLELTFPKARHYVQQEEWRDVLKPGTRAGDTYWPENFELLKTENALELVAGEREIIPGVKVALSGGHTRGHQIVWLESEGESAVHMGDLLPSHTHFNPLWVTAYDNFPLDSVARKEEIETVAVQHRSWFLFYHDPFMAACRFNAHGEVIEKFVDW